MGRTCHVFDCRADDYLKEIYEDVGWWSRVYLERINRKRVFFFFG